MANMIGTQVPVHVVDKRRSTGNTATTPIATPANYASESALDTRLSALGYSDAYIRVMTQNDKVFAVRSADDSAGMN